MGWLGQAQTQRGNVGNYMNIYIYIHIHIHMCVYTLYIIVFICIYYALAPIYTKICCALYDMHVWIRMYVYAYIYTRFVSKFTYIKMQIPTATNTPGPSQLIKSSKIKEN